MLNASRSYHLFTYLYYSSRYITKFIPFLIFITLLEFFPIYSNVLHSARHFYHYFTNANSTEINTLQIDKIYNYISILPLLKPLMTCSKINQEELLQTRIEEQTSSQTQNEKCVFTFYILIPILLLMIIIIVMTLVLSRHILNNKTQKEKHYHYTRLKHIFLKLIFNFYDYIYNRVLFLFVLFILSNYLIFSIQYSNNIGLMIVFLLSISLVIYISFCYCLNTFVYCQLGYCYPFDYFTMQYDTLILFLKIMIALDTNINIFHSIGSVNVVGLFFGSIGICALLFFVAYNLIKFTTNPNHIVYYSNENCNLFRFSLLLFTSFSVLFQMIFQNEDIVLNISANVSLIGLSLFILFYIKRKRMVKIYNGNVVNQLLFLIDHYSLIKEDNDKPNAHWNTNTLITHNQYAIQQFNRNIFINHLNQCSYKNKDCSLCKLSETPVVDNYELLFQRLFNGLYEQFNFLRHTNSNDCLTELFGWRTEAVQFIHQIISLKENYYLFSYHLATVLNRLSTKSYFVNNNVMSANILTYYKQNLKKLEQSIVKVNILLSIEEQSTIINNILDEWDQALFIKVLNPFNLITSSLKMNQLWRKVFAIINTLEKKNNYQSIIIKYIVEKLLKKKLKHGGAFFDITGYDEILNDCYLNNKHMTLTLDLKSQHINILSSGREFFKSKSKPFKDIFFSPFEDLALEKFRESIREVEDFKGEYRLFQFPIKDLDNPQYLLLFRLKYIILPTINIKDCLILGLYQTRRDALILTMINSGNRNSHSACISMKKTIEERLITYSYTMKKDLIITMDLIEVIHKNKYTIDINQLFTTNPDKSVIVFNYKKYCSFLERIVNQLFKNNELLQMKTDNPNSKLSKYEEIKEQIEVTKTKTKEIKLKGQAEFDFPNKGMKMILYSLERENDTRRVYNNIPYSNDNNKDFDFSTFIDFAGTTGSTNLTAYSSANNSSFLDNSTSSQLNNKSTQSSTHALNHKFREEYKEKKRQSRIFSLFTSFILGSNLTLIVLTVAFLFTQIDMTNKFISMLDLFILWSKLIKLFFNSTLNIFFNLCIGKLNEVTCNNSFKEYEKEFSIENNLPPAFSIQTYMFNELIVKADSLREVLNDVSSQIYTLNEEEILFVAESDFRFRYISVVEKDLSVKEDVYLFLNALKVYLNLVNMIMENDDYATKPIYILNVNGPSIDEIQLDNINLDAPLTQNQITGYNIILNFPLYISTFFSLNEIIYRLLLRNIDRCKKVVIAFSITIIAIHFLLMVLCFWFTYFFKENLELQVMDVQKKLSDLATRDVLKEKYYRLKILAGFFKENPNDIIAKFGNEENKRLKELKDAGNLIGANANSNTNHPLLIKGKTSNKSNYISNSYKAVLRQPLTLLYSVFGFYFTYSLVFIILLLIYLSNFTLLINIFSENITLDIYMSSITGLLQVTIMTNQTEQELEDYLNQTVINMEAGFSQTLISESYSYLFTIQIEEQKDLIPFVESINCFSFFDEIQDDLLLEVNSRFEKFDYSLIIPHVCNSYAFMNENNSKVVITEILYRSTKLLKSIEYNYDKLYEINNSYELFDLYLILIIIFRPIRNYETITMFQKSIEDLTNQNNLLTYVYLCCNIVIEVFLFFAIRENVIKKYKLMNKSMNQMINSIAW